MNHFLRFASFSILIQLSLTSCKKNSQKDKDTVVVYCVKKTNNIDSVRGLIQGIYNWKYSKVTARGVDSYIETPQTIGQTQKYVIDKNNSASYYVNNILNAEYNYEVDYEFKITNYPSDSSTVVIFKDKQTGSLLDFYRVKICNDSAVLFNPYNSISRIKYYKRN
jgi:hypothetical protein